MTPALMQSHADPRGSVWRRWDPHIHTPGTAMNNQFGPDDWDEYLTRIEQSEPRIEAIGVTDYCSIDQYEKVLAFQKEGRLAGVGLIFPNIELRLPTATKDDRAVNLHLLVSPAVSYTHLDVYKRQPRGTSWAPSARCSKPWTTCCATSWTW